MLGQLRFFLFVVMMLNIKLAEINEKRLRYLPIGGLLGILFLFEIFLIVDNDLIPLLPTLSGNDYTNLSIYSSNLTNTQYSQLISELTNIESVGILLYTYYFYYFLLASLILLVAMIGAIVLTMHKGVYVKRQQVFSQNTRNLVKQLEKSLNIYQLYLSCLFLPFIILTIHYNLHPYIPSR